MITTETTLLQLTRLKRQYRSMLMQLKMCPILRAQIFFQTSSVRHRKKVISLLKNWFSKTEQSTEATSKTELDMDQAPKCGQTEQSTRANGASTKQTERVNSGMQMEMFMKDNGKRTRRMAMVFMFMSTVPNTKDTGVMIFKMAQESNPGLTVLNTKVAIKKV